MHRWGSLMTSCSSRESDPTSSTAPGVSRTVFTARWWRVPGTLRGQRVNHLMGSQAAYGWVMGMRVRGPVDLGRISSRCMTCAMNGVWN